MTSSWKPHFYYRAKLTEGTVRVSFQVRFEPDAHVVFDWRDWTQSQYLTGPGIRVEDGTLSVKGKTLMTLKPNTWSRIEMSAAVGPDQSGRWTLDVIPAGGVKKTFTELEPVSPNWRRVDWFGFSSLANEPVAWYLDDFQISRSP
ncbi:MAG: hypothetical protein AAF492_03225 [Verrucomicrobiota bacterium]